ncbi:MAG TPA: glucokinase, partial [Burkholderiaceae bacterium]
MTTASTYPRLLGDVGGTNARFAWAESADAPLSDIAQYPCADYPSLAAAISGYMETLRRPRPSACGIGIANPVVGDQIKMTNHHWSFSISQLRQQLQVERLAVINDFTALALSLPALGDADRQAIGGGTPVGGEPLAVIGAGTGLGMSGLLPSAEGRHVAVAGEGGHASLAANDEEEAAVIALLRERFGHVSAERALSGPGLVNLYEACSRLAGV